ncbi:MAG: DUF1307 domain-containing protein [Tissierellia bacterium]|nr:DUF1307 domain-containing protein [Tissierellia bacterium]
MKKSILILILISLLLTSSCSFVKKQSLVLEEPGVFIDVVIQYKGGQKVNELFQKVTWYDILEVDTLEEAELDIAPSREALKGLDGIEYSLVFEDRSYTEKIAISYEWVSKEDLMLLSSIVPYGQDLEISDYKKALEVLESQGFTKRA